MGESLDIAQKLDELGSPEQVLRPKTDITAILECIDSACLAINCLLFIRSIAIGLPELATQSARDYFQVRKEKMIEHPFKQALGKTPLHKKAAEKMLAGLKVLPLPADNGNTLSWDDVLIYPTLRNLTMVKGLVIPAHVSHYIQAIAALTGTHTYYDRAI